MEMELLSLFSIFTFKVFSWDGLLIEDGDDFVSLLLAKFDHIGAYGHPLGKIYR